MHHDDMSIFDKYLYIPNTFTYTRRTLFFAYLGREREEINFQRLDSVLISNILKKNLRLQFLLRIIMYFYT